MKNFFEIIYHTYILCNIYIYHNIIIDKIDYIISNFMSLFFSNHILFSYFKSNISTPYILPHIKTNITITNNFTLK